MVSRPAIMQKKVSWIPIFSNWNSFRKKGIFMISIMKRIALPMTHDDALFRVIINSKMFRDQERFDRMMDMFATIRVKNDMARICPSLWPV